MKKHGNVSIFVPHNGCPHQCSFCNQKNITGQVYQPTANEARGILDYACKIADKGIKTQIAFFGGSFTAIEKSYMTELLDTAFEYVKNGCFDSIRLSTRPDCISDEILEILKARGVRDIELGCQSMDDEVLKANERGHSVDDVIKASEKIKNYGFSLGLQMMTGLYKSTVEKDIKTAYEIVKQEPATVRIYPTVIMKNTKLCDLYNQKVYKPYDLDTTVELCAELLDIFRKNNIKVIRLGLHYSDELKENAVAGAFHPALGELCEGEYLFRQVLEYINKNKITTKRICICVSPSAVSKMIGHKKRNIEKFKKLGYSVEIKEDRNLKEKGGVVFAVKGIGDTRI